MNTLVILSLPSGCVQCDATKRYINKKGIPATILDGSTDENRELGKSLGYMQAPVGIVYNEAGEIVDSWSGFNPGKMDKFIPDLQLAA